MKKILGLDLGTNSIGWALVKSDFEKKEGNILGMGSRIIPMSQDILGKFESGNSISQTAERTHYRSVRRLNERFILRRERLHRVLNVLGFLPEHYANAIDFQKKLGQFRPGIEVKLNYKVSHNRNHQFIFKDAFEEMIADFEKHNQTTKIPYDWTLYYLRKKSLTEAIGKQELAWVILSFNQKRGYYQLRGEEEEQRDGKTQEYNVLSVKELIDTGDNVKGKPLYKVVFENGWEYDREITKTEDWKGKKREFIVTSKTNNDGSVKRTFKKVDSEKDWIAIKKKTEQDIESTEKKVGEYIYDSILENPQQKIKGNLVKTIDRKYYKDELKQILRTQKEFHSELKNDELYQACLNELYPRNEAHQNNIKDKDFTYLFLEDIVFYQRPLKSKKSTISNCPYEKRFFKKNGEVQEAPLKCIAKSNPLFQEFRLWQFIQNLKIYKKISENEGKDKINEDVTKKFLPTEEAIVSLFDFLYNRKEIEQKQLLKYFNDLKLIPKQPKDNPSYRWNYIEDKKYPCNPTRADFLNRLKKVNDVKPQSFLTPKIERQLWHVVYSVTDKKEFEQALKTFTEKKNIDADSFVENFKKTPPYDSDYGAYSEKAIKKLIPFMRLGKYWNENELNNEAEQRIADIVERLKSIDFNKEKIEKIADDASTKQALKSFLKMENKNPHKGLNTYQACYAVYERHSEVAEIINWKSPNDIDVYLNEIFKQHQLRNPIVEQVVTETLRVVRDIWKKYGNGEKDFFDEIHLELGREMKNSKEKREQMSKRNTEKETTNQRIKAVLEELKNEGIEEVRPYSPNQQEILKLYEEGVSNNAHYDKVSEDEIDKIKRNISPSKKDILRYKLWLEQGYISPYTGNIIPMSKLFTTEYQVEHIIPQSRYFDNSFNNKVICESVINPYPYKDNQTAYEFIKKQGGTQVNEKVRIFKLEEYEQHCETYFKKNRNKLKNLLSEDIPDGFINRQLNDSRYISKFIKGILSNILREPGEKEATVKKLVPVTGAITGKLKQHWGLHDKWNEIIAPRFQRMNELTQSQDYGYWDNEINAFRTQVPDDIATGFSKKRIDHRHHALDALVIACITKDHINYITSINIERKNESLVSKLRETKQIQQTDKKTGKQVTRRVAKAYKKPWKGFTKDAKNSLEEVIISFKQNKRVINRTNNKTWHWAKQNGTWKKELQKQKGKNFAIRKPLHDEFPYGKIQLKKVQVPKNSIITAKRFPLNELNAKKLNSITDSGIVKILQNHLKNYTDDTGKQNFSEAFSPLGIEQLNNNIVQLNDGKFHQPIYKVRGYEVSKKKFQLGNSVGKEAKYVKTGTGTNLYFAIYWDEKKQKRNFETIPLNEVIEHQKQTVHLPMNEKLPIPLDHSKGKLLFCLSPNDLVYVPTLEEIDSDSIPENLNKRANEIYKMVSSSGTQCFFVKHQVSTSIKNKVEFSSLNKMEKDINGEMIKNCCLKLETDRLGNIIKIIK